MCPNEFGNPRDGYPTRTKSVEENSDSAEHFLPENYEVDLFNIDSIIEEDIDEIVGNVSGDGYRWVWLLTGTSVEKAHRKAVIKIKYAAGQMGCNAVIGLTTNVTYFPGFLGFRGCSVLLTGTAVKISYE